MASFIVLRNYLTIFLIKYTTCVKEITLLFSVDVLNESKVTLKTFTLIQKISNKSFSFELSEHQIIVPTINQSINQSIKT